MILFGALHFFLVLTRLLPTGWLYCCSSNFSWAHAGPGANSVLEWHLLCLWNRRDLPRGRKPVHLNHCPPRHASHFHAPGVWSHCPVHNSHTDKMGAVSARLHPTAHKNPTKGCAWNTIEHCIAQSRKLRSKSTVWMFLIHLKFCLRS